MHYSSSAFYQVSSIENEIKQRSNSFIALSHTDEIDYFKHATTAMALAKLYCKKAKLENSDEDKRTQYIYAAAMCQYASAALTLAPADIQQQTIDHDRIWKLNQTIEKDFLATYHTTVTALSDLTVYKNNLQKLREIINDTLKNIETPWATTSIQSPLMYNLHLLFDGLHTTTILELSIQVVDNEECGIRSILQKMVQQCHAILQGPPINCEYAIIGLGSYARYEMTPYSDLEFAILINQNTPEYVQYFRKLTQLLNLMIVQLGETIIPALWIPHINNVTIGEKQFFDKVIPRGLAFDSAMPKAQKTPLFGLIKTPAAMAACQKNSTDSVEDRHTARVLSVMRYIDGNEELITEYQHHINQYLDEKTGDEHSRVLREKMGINLLWQDGLTYHTKFNRSEEGKIFDVKKDIYRFLNTILDDLALILNLPQVDSWSRTVELFKRGYINEKAMKNIVVVISIAIELRFCACFHANSQRETMSLTNLNPNLTDDITTPENNLDVTIQHFQLPIASVFRYYQTVLPMSQLVMDFFLQNKNNFQKLFDNHDLFEESSYLNGLVYLRLQQFSQARLCFEQAVEEDPDNAECWKELYRLQYLQHHHDRFVVSCGKYLELLGNAPENQNKKIFALIDLARSLAGTQGGIERAKILLEDIEKDIEQHRGNISDSDDHNAFYLLSDVYSQLGIVYVTLDDLKNARRVYTEGIIVDENFYGKNHPNTADSCNGLATVFLKKKQFEQAKRLIKRAYDIYFKIYGIQHYKTAYTKSLLARCLLQEGMLEQAEQNFQMSEKIYHRVLGNQSYHQIFSLRNQYADELYDAGNFEKAHEFAQESLKLIQQQYPMHAGEHKLQEYHRDLLFLLARLSHQANDWVASYHYLTELLYLQTILQRKDVVASDDRFQINIYIWFANTYCSLYMHDEALKQFKLAHELNEKTGCDEKIKGELLYQIGQIFYRKSGRILTIRYLEKALPLIEKYTADETEDIRYGNLWLADAYADLLCIPLALRYYSKARTLWLQQKPNDHEKIDMLTQRINRQQMYAKGSFIRLPGCAYPKTEQEVQNIIQSFEGIDERTILIEEQKSGLVLATDKEKSLANTDDVDIPKALCTAYQAQLGIENTMRSLQISASNAFEQGDVSQAIAAYSRFIDYQATYSIQFNVTLYLPLACYYFYAACCSSKLEDFQQAEQLLKKIIHENLAQSTIPYIWYGLLQCYQQRWADIYIYLLDYIAITQQSDETIGFCKAYQAMLPTAFGSYIDIAEEEPLTLPALWVAKYLLTLSSVKAENKSSAKDLLENYNAELEDSNHWLLFILFGDLALAIDEYELAKTNIDCALSLLPDESPAKELALAQYQSLQLTS